MFLCDPSHNCDDDRLWANFYSVYATDQVDLTEKLKLRVGRARRLLELLPATAKRGVRR